MLKVSFAECIVGILITRHIFNYLEQNDRFYSTSRGLVSTFIHASGLSRLTEISDG